MRLRRWTIAIGAATLMGVAGGIPRAGAQIPVGGWSSPNVEWLGNVTLSGTTGAVRGLKHGRYFYAEGFEAIEIFDISKPTAPQRVSRIPLQPHATLPGPVGMPNIPLDGIDTNGEVLITSASGTFGSQADALLVYDVRDKSAPRLLARVPGAGYYFTCVARCSWAYAASGEIIDLRDPSRPQIVDFWDRGLHFTLSPGDQNGSYSLTDITPDRLVTGSTPMYLLDVSRPTRPRVLAESDGSPHSRGWVTWPRFSANGIALTVSAPFMTARCELQDQFAGTSLDSALKTWDVSHWSRTGVITGLSEYRLQNGTYVDGDPAFSGAIPNAWACGTTGVDAHPRFLDGGLAVMSASSHGVKFLEVSRSGAIEEVGWFLPYLNDTFGAYWITDEIVYTVDWPRGIDILRFKASQQ
ncbi:MAG: LVIVD repeat-containing protein [Actinomycetota bacterium]